MELSRPVRVLFIPQWYPGPGPSRQIAGTFCREHVRAASRYDDVSVLSLASRLQRWPTLKWECVQDRGVPTFYGTYGRSPVPWTTRSLFPLQLRQAFRHVVAEWGWPDVIHTQDDYAYYAIRALQRFRIPFVISQHWTGFMERAVDRRRVRRFEWAFRRSVRVLHANKFAKQDYEPYSLQAPMTWLPNALDIDVFHPLSNGTRLPWLLHASGFTPAKRLPDILEAFSIICRRRSDAVLHLVGDGQFRTEMQRLASRQIPGQNVYFHGALTKPELAELMRQSAGFVLASDAETFGCVLMEAMACGCPVLTTRVGGIPAVVRDGEGLFAEVGNIDQLMDGMERLLEGRHGLDLGRISRDTRARFSHETIGRVLHDEHVRAVHEGFEDKPRQAYAISL